MVALSEEPNAPEGMKGKDLELFKVGYRLQMIQFMGSILTMREATLKEDAEALKASYDALSDGKKHGHENYRDF